MASFRDRRVGAARARAYRPAAALAAALVAAIASAWPTRADIDLNTKFTNQGGIVNTRHNLTQAPIGPGAIIMNPYRNDYVEVCVYCHTPHGANTGAQLPLWNRATSTATYTTYDALGTSTLKGTVRAPGPRSLACLSCHDGTTAVDAIINMPGPGRYNPAPDTAFLNTWINPTGPRATAHMALNQVGCLACHSSSAGPIGAGSTDFRMFAIGTDLRDDHPIAVRYPSGDTDFRPITGTGVRFAFFDRNGDGRLDTNEVRLYDSGVGYEVECASCHDPHGVPSSGPASVHIPSFLRVSNVASALCQTCHNK